MIFIYIFIFLMMLCYVCFIPEKCKLVRNTRTQTSPQESVSSEESPLRTPLPRKRPPIPTSRYNLPRSHANRLHSDVDRGVKRKARVRVEPDVSPTLPSYMNEMTDKGSYCKVGLFLSIKSNNKHKRLLSTHEQVGEFIFVDNFF